MKKKKRERGGTEGGMIKERDERDGRGGGSVRVSQKISIVSTLSSGTWTVRYPTTACLEHSCRSLEWNVVQRLLNAELCGTASAVLFS